MLSETTIMLSGDLTTNIDSLPDEILFDILVCLAADYLYDRARHVCRRWWRIIQNSDAFTSSHFQQHSTYGLLLSSLSASPPHSTYVTATPDGRIETSNFSHICTNTTSANGLVVKSKTGALPLHVINPVTKKSFRLPSVSVPHGSIVYRDECGIAYSAASMEYKVTLPYYTTLEDGGKQYCLDIVTVGVGKSWRRVEFSPGCDSRITFYKSPISSEGFLHWGRRRFCLTLNAETEIITRSEVPIPPLQCYIHNYSYDYLSTGRYLTLLASRNDLFWEVWEMKPAESGEWRKVLSDIDLEPQKSKLAAIGNDKPRLFPLGWVKYPEVLAFNIGGYLRQTCIFYNLETHEINTIHLPHNLNGAIVHRKSLVWLS